MISDNYVRIIDTIQQLIYGGLQWSYRLHSMLDFLKHLMIYFYVLDTNKDWRQVCYHIFLLNIWTMMVLNGVTADIKCYLFKTAWIFISIITTNRNFQQLCNNFIYFRPIHLWCFWMKLYLTFNVRLSETLENLYL